ncbi:MAG: DUF721 domain-containing protein [Candidatus Portnoybacteria bacterium]|nr:DUF721 domain-containing protein [Candidatus Portnoybacteria bacterium]
MAWTALKRMLPETVQKLNLGPVLEFNQLTICWDGILAEELGEPFRKVSKPISLKNKILLVDCLNSTWAQELQFKCEPIKERANKLLQKETICQIRFIS